MTKKYKFDLAKYYTEDELNTAAPIVENFVNLFADDNGTATLSIKEDISINVKREEGLVIHMVLENADRFTALPKTLAKPKDFIAKFIRAMSAKIDEQKTAIDVEAAKAKVEQKAEDDLLSYMTDGDKAVAETPEETVPATSKTTVRVNGKEVTDPEEKQKVIDEMNEKKADFEKRMAEFKKKMSDTFDSFMSSDLVSDWFKSYLK